MIVRLMKWRDTNKITTTNDDDDFCEINAQTHSFHSFILACGCVCVCLFGCLVCNVIIIIKCKKNEGKIDYRRHWPNIRLCQVIIKWVVDKIAIELYEIFFVFERFWVIFVYFWSHEGGKFFGMCNFNQLIQSFFKEI